MLLSQNVRTNKKIWANVMLGFISLAGLAVRLYQFGAVPEGLHQDEAFSGWNAYALFHQGIDSSGHGFPPYFEVWGHGQSALNSYMMLPFLFLNNGTLTAWIIRMPQMLTAIAAMIAAFFLGKELFTGKYACIAAAVYAVCPILIVQSRWGLDCNLESGFLLFGFFFFVKAIKQPQWYLLSAVFYGLSLYTYALSWISVPVILVLQIVYLLWKKKARIHRDTIGFCVILGIMAAPLLWFLGVNYGILPEINIGPFSIYKMASMRSNEFVVTLPAMLDNIKGFFEIMIFQTGQPPYSYVKASGLFYNGGLIFIFVGTLFLIADSIKRIKGKEFSYEILLLVQLIGTGIICVITRPAINVYNGTYIVFVMIQAYGIYRLYHIIKSYSTKVAMITGVIIATYFAVSFVGFTKNYFTVYKQESGDYLVKQTEEIIEYVEQYCQKENVNSIHWSTIISYSKLLAYTQILPADYLDTVIYKTYPDPQSFIYNDITMYMGYDAERIDLKDVYVYYVTDEAYFLDKFDIIEFGPYWRAALPKK